ncbi:MAG: hypothetical protein JXP34_17595 [Planctomycetes bacterium]|nr:hypothetical protein [Planctomycetota bacterium]
MVLALGARASAQNRALEFSGGQCVAIPWSEALDFDEQVTVEAWIYATELKWYNTILRRNTDCCQDNYDLRLWNQSIQFICKIDGDLAEFGAAYSFQERRWYHVAGTYDGERLRIFVDGNLLQETQVRGRLACDHVPTYIGHGDGEWFRGRIDEVRLWKIARTEEEIRQAMGTGVPSFHPDLVGSWTFNEGDGQIVRDSTPNGLDGTLGENDQVGADDPVRIPSDAPVSCVTLERIEPDFVGTAGGPIVVFGTDFAERTSFSVFVDGTPVPVRDLEDQRFITETPPHADGTVLLAVQTECGRADLPIVYRSHFIRGDVSGEGAVTIADPILILYHLFADRPIDCPDAADINDNGTLELADPVGLLMYLFSFGFPPPPPFPQAGPDPTDDGIRCGRS